MTQEEWYKKYYCYSDGEVEVAAWNFQQQQIEDLENKISDLESIIAGFNSEGRTLQELKDDYGILS